MLLQNAIPVMIEPITEFKLEKVQKLLQSSFSQYSHLEYPPEKSIALSFAKDEKYFRDEEVLDEELFILTNEKDDVIGTTGLYIKDNHTDTWLSWFCIEQSYHGKGLGKKLLEWTLNRAYSNGFKQMLIETSTHKNEASAQKLYQSFGFEIFETFPALYIGEGEKVIHRKKVLR